MKDARTVVSASLLCKTYELMDEKIEVFRDVSFQVEKGQFTAIGGPSGSGKTTLLNIISGIDKPSSGELLVLGEDLSSKDENFLASFRCSNIGFVFQSYNLVSTLTVAENVAFPMEWLRKTGEDVQKRVQELLELVGLEKRFEHFPFQLSGGEQQRVAFARALANDPPLLLVDEPTGNLDAKTSSKIIDVLRSQKESGKTIIVATHDSQISELAEQRLALENGGMRRQDE
jgi:putative ABC transport system ATP-binding protein